MEKIDQVPQERDLVDFTQTAENYSEDNQQKIRISNGINLKDLRDEGIVFDPEIPDYERWRREEEKEYFTQWVKGGGPKFFLPLGSTGLFFSTLKVPRTSFHLPDTKFVKFGTSSAQKRAKNSPNWAKWRSKGSGGPKLLEQRGTKVERVVGGPSRRF